MPSDVSHQSVHGSARRSLAPVRDSGPEQCDPDRSAPAPSAGIGVSTNGAGLRPGSDSSQRAAEAVRAEFLAAYSGHTHAAYRRDLANWFAHCADHQVAPLQATRSDLALYLQDQREQGKSPATLARRLTTLRGYYALAVDEYDLPHSPAQRIRCRTPQARTRARVLTADQLGRFLAAADASTPRTAGLAWLLATTGLRISEACGASIDDLTGTSPDDGDSGRGSGSGGGSEPWLEVTCKGQVRRSVPVTRHTWLRLAPLLAPGTGPLFATSTGRPLDRRAAARTLAKLATTVDLTSDFSPHILRHTFVTLARAAGCALEDVQDAAGHADPATTRRYDRTLQTHAHHPGTSVLALAGITEHPTEQRNHGR